MPGGAGAKRSGVQTERKVRKLFEEFGWRVVRSGGSLGAVDLVCFKGGKVLLVQVKRRAKRKTCKSARVKIEGFDVHTVVDFGGGDFRIERSGSTVSKDSSSLIDFLSRRPYRQLE